MASTFSPSLRIELIGDGDQSGIWGQTTNNNLGTLIEQAISGVVTITMTDANYTLTSFNGVSDEARNMVLVLSGTNTQQRNVIAPLVEKTYIVRNSTAGGQAVQIIGATGTGVIVPNGSTVQVYCDGTNFNAVNTGATGNFNVAGNLTVTGTTTLTGALSGSTAAFSGAITSVSPSFSGTPTAVTAPNGTNTTQIATTAFVQNFATTLGTMSTQNANNVAITGGTMSGMTSIAGGTVSGTTITASTQFTGPGTGLTGTAAGLSIGGNAATVTNGVVTTGAYNDPSWIVSLAGSKISGAVANATNATNSTTQPVTTNNTTIATTAFVRSIIPAGVILMWSGSVASIPSGWLLCDGNNGTPDLRNRFIVGAGSTYTPGNTGGSADAIVVSHSHTFAGDPLGNHSHTLTTNRTSKSGNATPFMLSDPNVGENINGQGTFGTSSASAGTPSGTISTVGSSGTNANLPPYYALAYIMKS